MGKVIIDANVLISAAFGGIPLEAVGNALSHDKLFLSPDVVAEVDSTIRILSPRLGPEKTGILEDLWTRLREYCEIVASPKKLTICRDPKDDAYLSLCAAVGADYLVTGDRDLLDVETARESGLPSSLKILTPRQYLELEP